MKYNHSPIMLTEGIIYMDGVRCFDAVQCEIKFTPDVWEGRLLGEVTPSSRWKGVKITGTITRRRSTPWLEDIVKKYMKDKVTPEFTIQGVMNDKNSDYYQDYGDKITTVVGCVITGDVNLIKIDTNGDVFEDVVSFNAKDVL